MSALDIPLLRDVDQRTVALDTGLTYDGTIPVRIEMTKRDGRYEFSDGGGAVEAAGVDVRDLAFDDHVRLGPYSANVSRKGIVSLPGFERSTDEWLAKLPELVAEASVVLYEALLDLQD
jgi:hypothetical protein